MNKPIMMLRRLCAPAARSSLPQTRGWLTSYTPVTRSTAQQSPRVDPTSKFGDPVYWEAQYTSQEEPFEWFLPYEGDLREHLLSVLTKMSPGKTLLHVGCGTSDVGPKLAAEPDLGLQVTDIDDSASAVRIMCRRHRQTKGYRCSRANALNLPFPQGKFDAVVDKGTFDALLCRSHKDAQNMAVEVHRVLRKGGIFLQITNEDPDLRLDLLKGREEKKQNTQGWSRRIFREIGSGEQVTYYLYILVK